VTLRGKIVALVVGLTVAVLAGLGLFLSASWSGWSREAVERDLDEHVDALVARVEVKKGEVELEGEDVDELLGDPAHPYRIQGPGGATFTLGELPWPAGDPEGFALIQDGRGRAWRVLSRVVHRPEEHGRGPPARLLVQVAAADAPFGALEARFRRGLLLALAGALAAGGLAAALLAHLSLAPLRRLAAEVDAIGAASLDRRVGAAGLDRELGRVASAFNDLLARLEAAMAHQRALVARASHALRTPTATILARAEVALRRDRPAAEYREALADVAASAREASALVTSLLALARLEERRRALRPEDVPLRGLASELVRLLGARAGEAGVALAAEVPEELTVAAEPAGLRELLEALLDNALHYTPRGGRAGLGARAGAEGVVVTVWDTGPGIAPDERAAVLERFHRGRAGEASGKPGSGLGLSLAKAIADAHGATLTLGDRPGGGLEVTIVFPGRGATGRARAAPGA
jgi:two-component system OmpR family sensor kinase